MTQTDQPATSLDSCPDCHARVDDLNAHLTWHSRLTHDIALAVVKQMERRTTTG